MGHIGTTEHGWITTQSDQVEVGRLITSPAPLFSDDLSSIGNHRTAGDRRDWPADDLNPGVLSEPWCRSACRTVFFRFGSHKTMSASKPTPIETLRW
jgi:hypothetical protein